jgi:imidazolonepropionase-like amidohydrolase
MRTFFLLWLLSAAALARSPLAIRDARIVTAAGPEWKRGSVVIRDGLIEAVGESVTVPPDASIIDGANLTVYPGLIDALSSLGIPPPPPAPQGAPPATTPPSRRAWGPEDRPNTTSWVRAADLIQLTDRRIVSARSAGFTTAVTFPQRGIFAGQGAVFNLAGERVGEIVLSAPAGAYVTLTANTFSNYPGSLMGVIAYIRQVYLDAEHSELAKAAWMKNAAAVERPRYDRALEGVLESPRVLLPANRAVEIERMLRFVTELKRPAVLYGAHEAFRAADLLKGSGVPVLVNLKWPAAERDDDPDTPISLRTLELRENAPASPAALERAGVRFAFYATALTRPGEAIRAVRRAIDRGLSRAVAVRALSLAAAEIYGLGDRLGSIEKGKIANLTVTRGDLFDEKSKIEFVVIDGVRYDPAPEPPRRNEEGEQR